MAISTNKGGTMFRKHNTFKHLARAIVVVAVVTAVAVPSALASGDRTRSQACQTAPTDWVLVTDDLGIPSFQATGQSECIPEASCVQSAYPGWLDAADDLGLSNLITKCAPVQPAPATKVAKTAKPKVKRSAYRGWVVVTNEVTGGSKLVAISNLRG